MERPPLRERPEGEAPEPFQQVDCGRLTVLHFPCGSRAACLQALRAFDALAVEGRRKPLRVLLKVTSSCADPDLALKLKRAAPRHLKAVERVAILGHGGLWRAILSGYLAYLEFADIPGAGKIRAFRKLKNALLWLDSD